MKKAEKIAGKTNKDCIGAKLAATLDPGTGRK